MSSMSSSHQRKAPTVKTLLCPLCGTVAMSRITETCTLNDGLVMKLLMHWKCGECEERFFDDDAMRRIQEERGKQNVKMAM